jgi:hypothetical protein
VNKYLVDQRDYNLLPGASPLELLLEGLGFVAHLGLGALKLPSQLGRLGASLLGSALGRTSRLTGGGGRFCGGAARRTTSRTTSRTSGRTRRHYIYNSQKNFSDNNFNGKILTVKILTVKILTVKNILFLNKLPFPNSVC